MMMSSWLKSYLKLKLSRDVYFIIIGATEKNILYPVFAVLHGTYHTIIYWDPIRIGIEEDCK
jgi:hypothetical protein